MPVTTSVLRGSTTFGITSEGDAQIAPLAKALGTTLWLVKTSVDLATARADDALLGAGQDGVQVEQGDIAIIVASDGVEMVQVSLVDDDEINTADVTISGFESRIAALEV